jgi:PAS domain-containing protein
MYESICQKLMKQFNLDRSQVLLTFTHNHCGPRLREDLVDYYPDENAQNELVREYSDTVEAKIIETVVQAFSDLSPARLSIGEGTALFAVNRRNNVESDVPELLAAGTPLKGPVDHSVPVMAVHKDKDRLVAILFGYACHPTTLRFEKWCGDYPGFAQIALEKNHPGAMALFFTGCGGDQNPLPRKEVSLCEQYGNRLAEAVEKALRHRLKPIPSELRTAFEFVDLDYLKSPTRKELEDAFHDADQEMSERIRARWAERMLKKMDAGEQFASSYSYPIQVWRLGGILHWISLGGEAVVDYSLSFKKEFGPNTWVCGYANVLVAYIPSLRVYQEGGYEGGAFLYEYGHPANRWSGDVEERVVGAVNRLVRKVAANPVNVVDFKVKLDVVLKHDDGLHFRPIKAWKFDDSTDLGSYNTQQHWLAHSDGLFLVYTRRGANNDHIMRNRAPLFIAQVDPEELCVIRKTERVLIPEQGAPLGNFGAAAITETESWVTVSEFMWPSWNEEARKRGAAGRTFIARVIWSNPNRLIQSPDRD